MIQFMVKGGGGGGGGGHGGGHASAGGAHPSSGGAHPTGSSAHATESGGGSHGIVPGSPLFFGGSHPSSSGGGSGGGAAASAAYSSSVQCNPTPEKPCPKTDQHAGAGVVVGLVLLAVAIGAGFVAFLNWLTSDSTIN